MTLPPRIIQDFAGRYLPAGEFLLPVCTTRERALMLISALNYAVANRPDEPDFAEAMTDVYNAIYYAQSPEQAPCNDCGGTAEPGNCYEFTPAILDEIYPGNPYTGESVPGEPFVWYLSPEPNLTGAPLNALTTDLAQIAVDPPGTVGVVLHTRAAGTVEFHLHTINFGGLVTAVIDDNPLSVSYVQLKSDPFAAPPAPPDDVVLEVEVPDGEHFIRLSFIPWFTFDPEGTIVPLFGGAIRKIVVCTEDIMGFFRQPEFRFTAECGLEVSYDNGDTWAAVPGWDTYAAECFTGPEGPEGPTGPTGPEGPQGPQGPQGPAGEDCDCPEPGDPPIPDEPYGWPEPEVPATNTRCEVAYAIAELMLAQYVDFQNEALAALVTEGLTNAQVTSQLETIATGAAAGGAISASVTNLWGLIPGLVVADVAGVAGLVVLIRNYFLALDALELEAFRDAALEAAVLDDYACAMFNLLEAASIDFPDPATLTAWVDYVLNNDPSSEPGFALHFWTWLAAWRAKWYQFLASLPAALSYPAADCSECGDGDCGSVPAAAPEYVVSILENGALLAPFGHANPYGLGNVNLIDLEHAGWVQGAPYTEGDVNHCRPTGARGYRYGVAVCVTYDRDVCISQARWVASSASGLWGGQFNTWLVGEDSAGARTVLASNNYAGTGGSLDVEAVLNGSPVPPTVVRKLWFMFIAGGPGVTSQTGQTSRCIDINQINNAAPL